MNLPPRFLFDECIGKPVMDNLCALVNADKQFFHISDYFQQGIQDKEWIAQLAQDANWVVVTSDGGRQSKGGDKLPELCREFGIRHLILSPKLHVKKSQEKVGALSALWSEIALLHKEPEGTRWILKIKHSTSVYGLKLWIDKGQLKKPRG